MANQTSNPSPKTTSKNRQYEKPMPRLESLELQPLTMMSSQKRRVTSQDWFPSRSRNNVDLHSGDFSFNDGAVCTESDRETSALISFSESQDENDTTGYCSSSFDVAGDSSVTKTEETHDTNSELLFVTPTDLDVLLGRGGMTNNHAGNKRYREEVEKTKPMYHSCSTKTEKKGVSELLVAYVQEYGGRFLMKDPETKQWFVGPQNAARKKASQALRETKWKKEEKPGG
mmetsp:Transcript_24779/g.28352  ORF Transcript_24779/g.28352 Transcript_24779/m.28352 type:complete len:229 (+) Transcript_24779:84-770(+)